MTPNSPSPGEQLSPPSPRADQQTQALQTANEIRLARARLKAAIASGDIFAASVLLDPPREAHSWRVGQMLTAQRRWGTRRMQKFLTRNMISEIKPVGMLTERQRKLLAGQLNGSPGGRG
jgi:hypothetical protein